MKNITRTGAVLSMLCAAFSLFSCQRDMQADAIRQEKSSTVTFKVNVPTSREHAASRALADADEYGVETIDVLIFEQGRYDYTAAGKIVNAPVSTGGGGAVLSFDAEILLTPTASDFMIVANARQTISNAYAGGIPINTLQSDVEKALLLNMPSNGWISNPASGGYVPFPMWGYVEMAAVNGGEVVELSLTRMLAKVDVQLNGSLVDAANPADGKFQLRSVRVYNYATSGRMIPYTDGAFDWTTDNLANYTSPSLPLSNTSLPLNLADYFSGVISNGITQYIERRVVPTAANPYQSLKNELYLFEAPAGVPVSGSNYAQNPCLVIGGVYEGGAETYYRVDFSQTTGGTTTYLPILRNNSYTITITDVSGAGHSTPEEAYNSTPLNMDATILKWNNNAINTILTNGSYMLGLSQTTFDLNASSYDAVSTDNKLTIVTDFSGGWSVKVCSDAQGETLMVDPWITVSPASGTTNFPTGTTVSLNVDELLDNTPRTAYLVITAGSLEYILPVTQNSFYIRFSEDGQLVDSLLFVSKRSLVGIKPEPRQITVEWQPGDRDLLISKTMLAGANVPFIWSDPSTGMTRLSGALYNGSFTFNIDPTGISATNVLADPFYTRASEFNFTIDGTTIASDPLLISQIHYNIVVSGLTGSTGATSATAIIKSNAPWTKVVEDPDAILKTSNIPASGPANEAGASYTYAFSDNKGVATFTFSSPDGLFDNLVINVAESTYADFFAKSNIVMATDGANTILTFAETAADNGGKNLSFAGLNVQVPIAANSMGLMFRWGSLFGIAADNGLANDVWDPSRVVFIPDEYISTHPGAASTPWQFNIFNEYTTIAIDEEIPFFNKASLMIDNMAYEEIVYTMIDSNFNEFIVEYPASGFDAANGIGDICRYISEQGWVEGEWRTPTAIEIMNLLYETPLVSGGAAADWLRRGVMTPYRAADQNSPVPAAAPGTYGQTRSDAGFFMGAGALGLDDLTQPVGESTLFFPLGGAYLGAVYIDFDSVISDVDPSYGGFENVGFGYTSSAVVSLSGVVDPGLYYMSEDENDPDDTMQFFPTIPLYGSSYAALPVRCIRDVDIPVFKIEDIIPQVPAGDPNNPGQVLSRSASRFKMPFRIPEGALSFK